MAISEPRLYIALYTDADVDGRLAKQIRAQGGDAISAYEVGNGALGDAEQLEFAVSQERAILTHNAKNFEPLIEKYWNEGKDHYGIVVSEQLAVGELLHRVLRLLDSVTADEMKNNFHNLGEFK